MNAKYFMIGYFLLIIFFVFSIKNLVYANNPEDILPLRLEIKSEKSKYSLEEEVIINYTIENVSSKPVGFYADDWGDLIVDAFDLSGNLYRHYYSPSAQRFMPSLYPSMYVYLKSNEKWEGSQILQFKQGQIKSYKGTKSNPQFIIDHDGYYLKCPIGCLTYDSILLTDSAIGNIRISAAYTTNDPNPKKYTINECKNANISLDVWPEEKSSNIIHHSVRCEGNVCNDFRGSLFIMDHENLAVYCQHNSALSKDAWLGTLKSNSITVELSAQ